MHQQKVCPEANERQTLCRLWDGFIVDKAYSSGRFSYYTQWTYRGQILFHSFLYGYCENP